MLQTISNLTLQVLHVEQLSPLIRLLEVLTCNLICEEWTAYVSLNLSNYTLTHFLEAQVRHKPVIAWSEVVPGRRRCWFKEILIKLLLHWYNESSRLTHAPLKQRFKQIDSGSIQASIKADWLRLNWSNDSSTRLRV